MERLRLAFLGLNAWLVVLVVPSLHHGTIAAGDGGLVHVGLALVPLVLLALGIFWLGTRRRAAQAALLALYPPAVGMTIALRPTLVEREVFDPLTIGLGALSLAAYAAAATHACARPDKTIPTTVHPSRTREPVVEPARRRRVRRWLLGFTALGSLGLVAMVPIWTSRTERVERWGEGADDGTVLTIIVATLAAAFALGAIVGPGLRARRRTVKRKARRQQLALALTVALLGGIGWLLLEHFDAAS